MTCKIRKVSPRIQPFKLLKDPPSIAALQSNESRVTVDADSATHFDLRSGIARPLRFPSPIKRARIWIHDRGWWMPQDRRTIVILHEEGTSRATLSAIDVPSGRPLWRRSAISKVNTRREFASYGKRRFQPWFVMESVLGGNADAPARFERSTHLNMDASELLLTNTVATATHSAIIDGQPTPTEHFGIRARVDRLHPRTGRELWSAEIDDVYFGTFDRHIGRFVSRSDGVVLIDLRTGGFRLVARTPEEPCWPVTCGDRVFAAWQQGDRFHVICLDAKSGAVLNQSSFRGSVGRSFGLKSAGSAVVLTGGCKRSFLLDRDGRMQRQIEVRQYSDEFVLDAGFLYVQARTGIACFKASGKSGPRWVEGSCGRLFAESVLRPIPNSSKLIVSVESGLVMIDRGGYHATYFPLGRRTYPRLLQISKNLAHVRLFDNSHLLVQLTDV